MAKKAAVEKPSIQNRIRELRQMRAGDLVPNPKNFRTHTKAQRRVLDTVLKDVGQTAALLAFPADGLGPAGDFSRLMLLDGHLRQSGDPETIWSVLVTDLTATEADQMLLVIDPLSEMAETSVSKLDELMAGVTGMDGAVASMLHELRITTSGSRVRPSVNTVEEAPTNAEYPITPYPGEAYDYCAIFCDNASDFAALPTMLNIERVRSYKSDELGMGRVITFAKFKRAWDGRNA